MGKKVIPKEATFTKDPYDDRDIEARWTRQMAKITDTIATGTFNIVTGDGDLVKVSEEISNTAMKIWTISGTHQVDYEIEHDITTAGGRRFRRTILIKVREK